MEIGVTQKQWPTQLPGVWEYLVVQWWEKLKSDSLNACDIGAEYKDNWKPQEMFYGHINTLAG